MAEEGLLAALHEQWGDEQSLANQPLTIRNVTSQLQLWLKGAQLRHLPSHLEGMRERVLEAGEETRQDLAGEVAGTLADLLGESLQDYQDLAYYLTELKAGVLSADRPRVQDDLLQLRASARSLADHEQALSDWMAAPVLRCPRCGGEACAACGLELLYPGEGRDVSRGTADLGPDFKRVHDLYVKVVRGETTLSALWPALDTLSRVLDGYAQLAESETASSVEVSRALDGIALGARDAADGVHLMQRVRDNRQTRDLHDGWQRIFDGCLALQGEIPVLARSQGERVPVAAGGYGDDAIILGADD